MNMKLFPSGALAIFHWLWRDGKITGGGPCWIDNSRLLARLLIYCAALDSIRLRISYRNTFHSAQISNASIPRR